MKNYIAVDWGSTHLRAWLINQGACINRLELPLGVTRFGDQTAAQIFQQHIAPWRKSSAMPVVMAGMIGSDAGWQNVPYLACPVSLTAIADGLIQVADNVWIIPGLKVQRDGVCNVMRGEETQLLGAMSLAPASCYVMPGTHSKWVQVAGDRVMDFDTAMTGELHHLLMTQSLLGKALPEQQDDPDAFGLGLERGMTAPTLVAELFQTRASWVLGALPRTSVSDYLSGLLIGAETAVLSAKQGARSVTLVGSETLTRRYLQAFARLNIGASCCYGDDALLQGIRRIIDAGQ